MSNRFKVKPQAQYPRVQSGARDVLLLTGNGLSLSLGASVSPALDTWNTSRPLTWDVKVPSDSGPNISNEAPLMAIFPRAQEVINKARLELPTTSSDFDVLNKAREVAAAQQDDGIVLETIVELRHLVALSYSSYQAVADEVDKSNWKLGNQLRRLARANRVVGAISFNYDLNLESVLKASGAEVSHVALGRAERSRIAVSKPHGSIDYAPHEMIFGFPQKSLEYPRTIFVDETNSPIRQRSRTN